MKDFLLIFDINDTLISKIKKSDKEKLNKLTDNQINLLYSCNYHYLLKRDHTDKLVYFLNEHKVDYIFWSTSMKHNIEKMIPYLESIGYNFHNGFMSQSNCDEGIITEKIKALKSIKNLEKASCIYKKDIKKCILIDNSEEKHVKGQNFIKIEDINLEKEDREIYEMIKKIDRFLGCKKDCSGK